LAKVAYDTVLGHQRAGSTITLTMWYTLVNHKENPSWRFNAKHQNDDGTWDCGLGQVNMKRCTAESFSPEWAIKKSIGILAWKNVHFANKDTRLTFKRYNGDGWRATEYARVCMKFYNQYMKGALR
jgi:hypothetical protein